jgi:hypothetical protein
VRENDPCAALLDLVKAGRSIERVIVNVDVHRGWPRRKVWTARSNEDQIGVCLGRTEKVAIDVDVLPSENGCRPSAGVLHHITRDLDIFCFPRGSGHQRRRPTAHQNAVAEHYVVDIVVRNQNFGGTAFGEYAGRVPCNVFDLIAGNRRTRYGYEIDTLAPRTIDMIVQNESIVRLTHLYPVGDSAYDRVSLDDYIIDEIRVVRPALADLDAGIAADDRQVLDDDVVLTLNRYDRGIVRCRRDCHRAGPLCGDQPDWVLGGPLYILELVVADIVARQEGDCRPGCRAVDSELHRLERRIL